MFYENQKIKSYTAIAVIDACTSRCGFWSMAWKLNF